MTAPLWALAFFVLGMLCLLARPVCPGARTRLALALDAGALGCVLALVPCAVQVMGAGHGA